MSPTNESLSLPKASNLNPRQGSNTKATDDFYLPDASTSHRFEAALSDAAARPTLLQVVLAHRLRMDERLKALRCVV